MRKGEGIREGGEGGREEGEGERDITLDHKKPQLT